MIEFQDIKLEDQVSEKDFQNGWTEITQTRFEMYLFECKIKIRKHTRSAQYFDKRNAMLSVPTVILSALVAAFSTVNIDVTASQAVSYIAAVLAILSTVADMLFAALALGKRSENHRQCIHAYSNLYRKIEEQLFLPIDKRDTVEANFTLFTKTFSDISAIEPLIPSHIDIEVMSKIEKFNQDNT